ncbi:protein RETARDED ROOT GROWTH-LIKE [Argentina anserina]|uniref:protein RETARDED ROOT GROWTH-LIKE n=1 Tax=Argentina anserina TaxID=57926 RepID=UPI0021765588|nr:protein RETARDED ROOT GROWTH-LIKE [Potentilla anserina]
MRRAIDAHLKTMRLLPPLSPLSSSPSLFSVCTFLTLKHPPAVSNSISKTLILHSIPTSPHSSIPSLRSREFRPSSVIGPFAIRCVSTASSPEGALEWNEPVLCSEVGEGTKASVDKDDKPNIPVRAYFISTSVDLRSLVEQNRVNFIPPTSRMTNYVVFRFGELVKTDSAFGPSLSGSDCCYMVVFQYGSIILFNVPEPEIDGYLKIVEKHASGLLHEMKKDEYEVREKPDLDTWMEGGLDYIMLQHLNTDGIRTIGSVLGQSIALDYYVRQVDGMVAEFTDINREMESTGKFKMKRKKLFQLVGKANSNLADVILKLGLFERSDIAWKDAKYAQIWEYLRDEFELTQRFASLDFKLKFVEHNIRFLQEILQNRKSDFLEWLIIALIGAEIMLSLYDILHRSALASL